ncbi:carbamoyl-phosphate synthase large subunit [Algoriella xinjiangensis]|uniref:Carbamoyl-phosphate synthase large subunit n=1 Tax=Algoriella xinjiangensis TaxID=684065 RepID=A0A1I4VEG6_9FLAO|nr:ATP-grasp domain-containing protein [Algoriella xinjiangensis]SFM99585.1 carbamoyl-phosphate synthase large subunit [Algoriella xinjiangensis]
MKKKIAILGASYLQLPLVIKAKDLGLYVINIAWDDGKAICKEYVDEFYDVSVLDKEQILKICKEHNIDGITTIATDICIPTIAFVAESLNLLGNNSYECSLLTTNKAMMRDCFKQNEIASPQSIVIRDINNFNLSNLNFPLIVKPSDRSGSLGVVKVSNIEQSTKAIEEALEYSFSKTCVVEEFIKGLEVSVETISWKGSNNIITITDKEVTDEPYFVELAHHQPSALPLDIQDKIIDISHKILKATKVENGASHIELKITSKGEVYPIEIGSRMGGDFIGSNLVELSTGFDFLKAVIDVALNQYKPKEIESSNNYSGVYFLSKNTEYLLPIFNNDNLPFIVKKHLLNTDLKEAQSSNDRSGYLIYQSNKKINL